MSMRGDLIKVWDSFSDIGRDLDIHWSAASRCCGINKKLIKDLILKRFKERLNKKIDVL